MKFHKTAIAMGVFALAASATSAFAQDIGANPFYVGAGVGQARATIDDERITRNLMDNGFASSITDRERHLGYKVYGGYNLNKNFALEAGYFNLGKFGYTATTIPAGTLTGDAKVRGLNLDLVGTLPVTEKFSVFARAGLTHVDTRDAFRSTGMVVVNNPNPSERSNNWKAGLGVQYAFTPALSLRAEIERYRIKDAVGNHGDVDMATVGLVYSFGAGKTAARTAQVVFTAPPPVIPPMEAVTPAGPPSYAPTSVKVTFAAAAFFDFDKSVLKPEGQAQLDELVASQQGVNQEVVIAAGHTDSVGTDAYNDKLSMRRAEAVKDYLVAKGLDAGRVYAEGKGERQPVADNATSEGRAQNRRVQIEFVGTRTK